MNSGASAPSVGFHHGAVRPEAAAPRNAETSLVVLAPGESEAHPPETPAHWDLYVRAFVVVGLALLSWGVVGAAVLLLLRR